MSRADTIARLSALRPPRKVRTSFSGAELMGWSDDDLRWLLIDTRNDVSRWEKRPAGSSRAVRLDRLKGDLALLEAEMLRRNINPNK